VGWPADQAVEAQPAQVALAQTVDTARTGFETTLQIQGLPEYVVVEALDASGTVQGASSAIPVSIKPDACQSWTRAPAVPVRPRRPR